MSSSLTFGSGVFDHRVELSAHRERFREADCRAREQSLPFMFARIPIYWADNPVRP